MDARHARKGRPQPDIEVRFLPTLEDQQPLPDFERQRFVRGFSWPSDPEGTEDDAWWHPPVRLTHLYGSPSRGGRSPRSTTPE